MWEIAHFKIYKNEKQGWEASIVTKRMGSVMCIIKGQIGDRKLRLNQKKTRHTEKGEEIKGYFYDSFDTLTPKAVEVRRSSNITARWEIDSKLKKY